MLLNIIAPPRDNNQTWRIKIYIQERKIQLQQEARLLETIGYKKYHTSLLHPLLTKQYGWSFLQPVTGVLF